jgi:hypothetical protein
MTKSELFKNAIAYIEGNPCEASPVELIEGLSHEIELLERKAATPRKPTKTQVENEAIKARILDFLATVERATVKEVILLAEGCDGLSSQKVTALLSQMVGKEVVRTVEKKVAYFSLA